MKTCLIVDDSSVIRKVARRILEGLEFEIVEAEDGEQASSACSPSSPSTISNSSPSRIRRATLRMTLESSTIKHVFIAHPRYLCSKVQQTFLVLTVMPRSRSRRYRERGRHRRR